MQIALRQKSYASSAVYAERIYVIAPGANGRNRDAWSHNPCSLCAEAKISKLGVVAEGIRAMNETRSYWTR
jgi:hypothetical protein